jgi:hypothetical protein
MNMHHTRFFQPGGASASPDHTRRHFMTLGAAAAATALAVPALGGGFESPAVQAKGPLNIMDFGAKGDGVADDTGAFRRALEAAAPVNGTVFIPEGIFLCSEIQVPPGVGIYGMPAWDYRKGMGTILKFTGEGRCLLNLTGAFGAYLYGLCLHGDNKEGGAHGILVDKPDYGTQEDTPRIDMCRVERFTGDGIRLDRIWCFVVRHSHCFGNRGCGLRVRGWDGFILDNWFSGNGMAGYGSYEENASNTITGNRIEWNREGGIVICGGSHYNITGNYIDRSGRCGLALLPREGQRYCQTLAITGNVIYRSGKPEWGRGDEYDSAQARLEYARGLAFVGNSMHSGRDDGGQGGFSPDYGIIVKGLEYSVVKDNVLFDGALRQVMVDLGGHGEGVVMADNVGCLRKV